MGTCFKNVTPPFLLLRNIKIAPYTQGKDIICTLFKAKIILETQITPTFLVVFKTSPSLPQLLKRMLQFCFAPEMFCGVQSFA